MVLHHHRGNQAWMPSDNVSGKPSIGSTQNDGDDEWSSAPPLAIVDDGIHEVRVAPATSLPSPANTLPATRHVADQNRMHAGSVSSTTHLVGVFPINFGNGSPKTVQKPIFHSTAALTAVPISFFNGRNPQPSRANSASIDLCSTDGKQIGVMEGVIGEQR
ncbi:hypothetical protein ACLOJK_022727 [Asimina triloba]